MRETDGELALLYAVLERAVLDAVCHFASQTKWDRENHLYNRRRARAWLFNIYEKPDELEPFTFEWVCENLQIAPDGIRRFTARLIEAYPKGAPLLNSRYTVEHVRQIFAEVLSGESPYALNLGKEKNEAT